MVWRIIRPCFADGVGSYKLPPCRSPVLWAMVSRIIRPCFADGVGSYDLLL
jgi:hypothetical protein